MLYDEQVQYIWDIRVDLREHLYPYLDANKSAQDNLYNLVDKFNKDFNSYVTDFSSYSKKFNTYSKNFDDFAYNVNTELTKLYNTLWSINDKLSDLNLFYYPSDDINTDYSLPTRQAWLSFWSTFSTKTFDEVLLDVHQKIEDEVNPLSENNQEAFNSNIELLKSETAYGSALELKDGIQAFYSNIAGASPTASLNVQLLPVDFFGSSIPAKTITIDFSWFAPYRDTTLSLWRFFLWVGYIFIIFKRFPDILSGAGLVTDLSTNGNITDGIDSSFYNITMDDDGNVLSATESHTYKVGNNTYRYNVHKDVNDPKNST